MNQLSKKGQMSGSIALRTNDMWSKTIGHDPYAEAKSANSAVSKEMDEQAANIMLLAKMSNTGGESRGGCKRCGGVGHLTFQCRNPVAGEGGAGQDSSSSSSDSDSDEDIVAQAAIKQAAAAIVNAAHVSGGDKIKAYKSSSSGEVGSKHKSPKDKDRDRDRDKERRREKKEKRDKKERREKREKKHDKKEKKEKKDKRHKKNG